MTRRGRLIQLVSIIIVQLAALVLLAFLLPGLRIETLSAALFLALSFALVQALFWWLFITFLAWLPVWLYPLLTFVFTGAAAVVVGNFIAGVSIDGIGTGIWLVIGLTAINAILGGLLSLDLDERFDRNVTRQFVRRRGKPIHTDIPGFLFLEIDGLSEKVLRRALAAGHMPTLKRWLDQGTHQILGWETDFSAQTGAMQSGILLGNNHNFPAYRWWDRQKHRIVMTGDPRDARALEASLSSGYGLLSGGGASRGNIFSGDATESLFTFSAALDRQRGRGPGFYFYLVSPTVIARLVTRYFIEVAKEWWQAWRQRQRQDKYIVSARNFFYAFYRAVMGPLAQDLTTYTVISDVLRGVPAVYALYAGYDDLAHYAGMETPEAFEMLTETDRYFARIERALQHAPRPYHVVVLSDHGQSIGPTFQAAHGLNLEELVIALVRGDSEVFASLETNEVWDNINAFLNASVNADTRTASVLRTALRSKTKEEGQVAVGPGRNAELARQEQAQANQASVVVLASGCNGLIYFTDAGERLTYEEIQARHPDLIVGLANHPGVGFVLVRSEENGDMVVGPDGIYFLDSDTFEGSNPLADFGPNAPHQLKRQSSFDNCPDLLVNTRYDRQTEELCGFENQVSHHGGLGGPQNHPFILHPVNLPVASNPIVGACEVHHLLRGWRETVQGLSGAPTASERQPPPLDEPLSEQPLPNEPYA